MKSRITVVLFMFFILSITPSAECLGEDELREKEAGALETIADVPRKTKLKMFKAKEKRDKGEFNKAADMLLEYIEKEESDKDHYLLRFQLANTLVQAERVEEALAHYQATVRLESRFKQGWLNLGETAYNLTRYGLAAEAILQGYRLSEDFPPYLLYYVATAYLMDEQPEKSIILLKELIDKHPEELKMDWYRALISAHADLADKNGGDRAVDRLLEEFGNDPEAWKLAFQFYASVGNYEQAAITLNVLGYLRPFTREESMQLGDIFTVIGTPGLATSYYQTAMRDSGLTKEYERLASAYLASYDTESALSTLEQALSREPTAPLYSLLGDLYYMEKNYRKAFNAFQSCAQLDPRHGRSYLMMGYCALEMGEFEEARDHLELATNFDEQKTMATALLERAKILSAGN